MRVRRIVVMPYGLVLSRVDGGAVRTGAGRVFSQLDSAPRALCPPNGTAIEQVFDFLRVLLYP